MSKSTQRGSVSIPTRTRGKPTRTNSSSTVTLKRELQKQDAVDQTSKGVEENHQEDNDMEDADRYATYETDDVPNGGTENDRMDGLDSTDNKTNQHGRTRNTIDTRKPSIAKTGNKTTGTNNKRGRRILEDKTKNMSLIQRELDLMKQPKRHSHDDSTEESTPYTNDNKATERRNTAVYSNNSKNNAGTDKRMSLRSNPPEIARMSARNSIKYEDLKEKEEAYNKTINGYGDVDTLAESDEWNASQEENVSFAILELSDMYNGTSMNGHLSTTATFSIAATSL